jgi:hypothetical protein
MGPATQTRSVMYRTLKAMLTLLLVATIVFSPVSTFAQSLPDKKEVKEWTKKNLEMSDLQSPSATPYHLVASFHYSLGNNTFDGTYEVLWAAPDHYRIEFRIGDLGETDVVIGDKKYVKRNTPTMTIPMSSISSILFPSLPDANFPWPLVLNSVHKVVWAGQGSTQQICAALGDDPSYEAVLCFAATKELLSLRIQPVPENRVSNTGKSIYLSDYATLGNMRYPQHLTRQVGPESVEVTVKEWNVAEKFDSNVFSPLTDATVWDWCSKPEVRLPKSLGTSSSALFVANGRIQNVLVHPLAFYEVVGADGAQKKIELVFGSPDGPAKEMLDGLRRTHSWVRVCGGKPVEYERIIPMWPTSSLSD